MGSNKNDIDVKRPEFPAASSLRGRIRRPSYLFVS
jgi:hypothetical protein